jgi:hypothetical protein
MMDSLFERVLPAERTTVLSLATSLSARGRAWAAPVSGCLRPKSFDSIAVTAAAIAPWMPEDDLLILVRYGIWNDLLDYLHDETATLPPVGIRRVGASVEAMLHRRRAPAPGDFFEVALSEVLSALSAREPGGDLVPAFEAALLQALQAAERKSLLDRTIRDEGGPMPSVEAYLYDGCERTNYRSSALALLILIGERPMLDVLDQLDPALQAASIAVRLADDLRTYPRDRAEGNLNVLLLGWSAERVKREIEQQYEAHRRRLEQLAAAACLPRSMEALERSIRLAIGLSLSAEPLAASLERITPCPPLPLSL